MCCRHTEIDGDISPVRSQISLFPLAIQINGRPKIGVIINMNIYPIYYAGLCLIEAGRGGGD